MNKVLLIDKPAGWTSFDVVAKIRNRLQGPGSRIHKDKASSQKPEASSSCKRLRVGHAGTLDPFATGLLIVLVGDETKNQDQYMKLPKEYEATLKLGYTSTTGDPEGTVLQIPNNKFLPTLKSESRLSYSKSRENVGKIPNKTQITKILNKFTGEQRQIPPKYSAIKIKGKKAYELARAGKDFRLDPRVISIYDLQILNFKYPKLSIKVKCSSGTYIRTLAEDIGKALGCGAYLTALRRTKIGNLSVKQAKTIEDIFLPVIPDSCPS